jgi:hypothetical protein
MGDRSQAKKDLDIHEGILAQFGAYVVQLLESPPDKIDTPAGLAWAIRADAISRELIPKDPLGGHCYVCGTETRYRSRYSDRPCCGSCSR